MIKILIAENIPSLNKGEMAIFGGMCETFKLLGNVKVYLFSTTPEVDNIRYKNKAEIIDMTKCLRFSNISLESKSKKIFISSWVILQHLFFLFMYKCIGRKAIKIIKSEIWKVYCDTDIVVVGHNGTFGLGGILGAPLFLMPLYIPLFSKLIGKPVIIYGASIDSNPKRYKKVINTCLKYVLDRVDLITLREDNSYKNLLEKGIKNEKMFVLPDPAFLLPPENPQRAEEIILKENKEKNPRPLIGITVTREISSSCCPKLIEAEKRYLCHNKMIAWVIDQLIEQFNANIIFLPHCIGLNRSLDDRIVSSDIYEFVKGKSKVKVITNEYTAEELKAIIGKCDLFIGERIHSVIGAISMGVPALAISYANDSRLKIISGVFEEKELVCEVENLDEHSLLNKVLDLWENKENIRERLVNKSKIISRRAMKNGELLKEVFEKHK